MCLVGKIVAVAGASGSGKTTVGLSILRLLPAALSISQGSIVFEGRSLLELPVREMQKMPGGAHRHGLPGAFKCF